MLSTSTISKISKNCQFCVSLNCESAPASGDSMSSIRKGLPVHDTFRKRCVWDCGVDEDNAVGAGYIACDGDSKSEIVVPIQREGREGEVVAIIDIDCAVLNGFDEVDRIWLEKLAVLVGEACDW
ncbi:hypothetical protein VTL71DRAFT_12423 [Oculimacula yallundae]|uniref:GAF domain-containing protein n=1 Tax=Oculimacula yallundae TaxID=86028 RepID=A0ABR4CNA1_9HELO